MADRRTRQAVERNLEIVGEAVKKLSPGVKARFPEIPWKRVAGLRDKLIHDYAGIEAGAIWTVVSEELPALRKVVERARAGLD